MLETFVFNYVQQCERITYVQVFRTKGTVFIQYVIYALMFNCTSNMVGSGSSTLKPRNRKLLFIVFCEFRTLRAFFIPKPCPEFQIVEAHKHQCIAIGNKENALSQVSAPLYFR